VVIGISAQRDPWTPLPNARYDAQRFAAAMRSRGATVIELLDEQATEHAIVDAIALEAPAALARSRGRTGRSLLVVYFVGHGHTRRGGGFLVPYGARRQSDWISMRELEGLAEQAGAFRHQLYVLASCFGGELLRSTTWESLQRRRQALSQEPAARPWLDGAVPQVARLGITAGTSGQRVPDGRPGAGSPFGNALINALESAGGASHTAADYNRDGCVSGPELSTYLEAFGRTRFNSPRSGTLDGSRGGTILLCAPARPPEPEPDAPVTRRVAPRAASAHEAPSGFVEVKAGAFIMGSPVGEIGRRADEGSMRRVMLTRSIWVQKTEVTQAQWSALMGTRPSHHAGCEDCPVEQVSWFEAIEYANRLSRDQGLPGCYAFAACADAQCRNPSQRRCAPAPDGSGRACVSARFVGSDCSGYRLPTEAEWEYAVRGGMMSRYALGDDREIARHMAWFGGNSAGRTHPVGLKAPNLWHISDGHGNVAEWCQDWKGPYRTAGLLDPTGPSVGAGRVVRGGAFNQPSRAIRAAHRDAVAPTGRHPWLGFRLVRTVPPGPPRPARPR